ncbi:YceD family protein [Marixanthomonas spongiae]|uniref:DUF177 domain-containing protein n=1 Tax=Marixanthomonas spongiae TaxID=2174845 RepID=A0A2U0I263_9FLAO|nr:DUF177 domain-containing protein [Marixanthomonas spongiae]PVW15199.1 hypothetical protein DDV96_07270 [Marixanthomonas spongiae]
MKELKEFTIPFVGLKIGEHWFEFTIEKPFFEHFEYNEFNDAGVKLNVLLVKKATLLEFTLYYKGTVNVNCDVSNEPYDQKIDGQYRFVVKFGEDNNLEDEDLLVLPYGSHEVNIQQFVYESIILAVPIKKVHPGIEDGTLKSDILDKLEELRPKAKNENPEGDQIDPRWNELKKLLTDK